LETRPDSRQGIAATLVALGLVAATGGLLAWFYSVCVVGYLGSCFAVGYPYRDLGLLAMVFGRVMFVVGLVLLATRPSHPLMPVQAFPGAAACPVCGTPMTWVAPENRWYCPGCRQYR